MSMALAEGGSASPRLFDLNIEEILENWDVEHALREVISNAFDEQNLTHTKEVQIFKDQSFWHIRDFGRGLTYEHLTQKENPEKQANPDLMIGKFGVGLKDAFATFDRKGIRFHIASKYGDITIEKAKKAGFEGLTTLHAALRSPSDANFEGTDFIFSNIQDEHINKAKSLFLKFSDEAILETTQFGQVIRQKPNRPCRIYVNGLKVAEEERFLFSYNITSLTSEMRKALNRERSYVGRTAYTKRVQSILLDCKTKEVAQLLSEDLQKLEKGFSCDEIKWSKVSTHAVRILSEKQENTLFVTSGELASNKMFLIDEAKRKEENIVVIPESVAAKIPALTNFSGQAVRNLDQYIEERRQSFQFTFIRPEHLTDSETKVFQLTDKIFSLIGGRPGIIKELAISETMRPGDTLNTVGLWLPGERKMIILRSQLQSLSKYASTLLHESAHALSGAPDISREFESQLTKLLGTIATQALQNECAPPPLKRRKVEEVVIDD